MESHKVGLIFKQMYQTNGYPVTLPSFQYVLSLSLLAPGKQMRTLILLPKSIYKKAGASDMSNIML